MASRLQALSDLVERALREGARGVEILLEEGEGRQLEVRRGKVTLDRGDEVRRLTVRCWLEGVGVGRASSIEEAEAALKSALEEASRTEPIHLGGPVQRLPRTSGGLGIVDRRYDQLTAAQKRETLVDLERVARTEDRRVKTGPFSYQDMRLHRLFVNSHELAMEEWGTHYRTEGSVRIENDVGPIEIAEHHAGRAFSTVASWPFGLVMARRALGLLGRTVNPQGPVRVVLPPRVTAALIEAIMPGVLRLRASFLDASSLHPSLHLVDDGALPGGVATRAFDDRGVPPVPVALLRNGQVHGRLMDPEEARLYDDRPTGHTWRGEKHTSNLLMRLGLRTVGAILAEIGGEALVLDHARDLVVDLDTGKVSLSAYGQLCLGGRPKSPFRGLRLTGNLGEVLSQVVEISSDADRCGTIDAPSLVVDGFEARSTGG